MFSWRQFLNCHLQPDFNALSIAFGIVIWTEMLWQRTYPVARQWQDWFTKLQVWATTCISLSTRWLISALNTATLTPRRMGSHTSLDLRQSLGTRLAPATVLVLKFEWRSHAGSSPWNYNTYGHITYSRNWMQFWDLNGQGKPTVHQCHTDKIVI